MTRRKITALAAAAVLGLAGCAAGDTTAPTAAHTPAAQAPAAQAPTAAAPRPAESLLAEHGLTGMAATEVVDHLDRLAVAERPADLTASVRAHELQLSDGEREVALDLPADRFYLSVAPYVDQTHDCFFHALTGCRGELSGEQVQVEVVDDATGEVLVSEQATTFDNGFVGLWLPRDVQGTVRVTAGDRSGQAAFSTTADGATCLTTLRLA